MIAPHRGSSELDRRVAVRQSEPRSRRRVTSRSAFTSEILNQLTNARLHLRDRFAYVCAGLRRYAEARVRKSRASSMSKPCWMAACVTADGQSARDDAPERRRNRTSLCGPSRMSASSAISLRYRATSRSKLRQALKAKLLPAEQERVARAPTTSIAGLRPVSAGGHSLLARDATRSTVLATGDVQQATRARPRFHGRMGRSTPT